MSYSDYAYTAQDSDPAFRLLFVQGTTEYRYTTEPYIVADSGGSWLPEQIMIGDISQSSEMAKAPIKFILPRDNAFAMLFLGGVPEQITSVTVFKIEVSDTSEEWRYFWKGRVSGSSASEDKVSIDCESIWTSLRRPGLRARYQKTCRHALYQNGCNLNGYDFAVAATATAVSGDVVTVPDANSSSTEDGYYVGGTLETADGFVRYIIGHTGGQLTLIRPLQSLTEEVNSSAGSASVTIYPGCDHLKSTCLSKFNNLANFGGFPWLPSKNPFRSNLGGSIV